MENDTPQLLLPRDYVAKATELAKKAERRIYVTGFSIVRCRATDSLIDAMLDATSRQVEVHVAAGIFTFVTDMDDSLVSRVFGKTMWKNNKLRSEFMRAGADFHWLGANNMFYLVGCTHSKWLVIDDDVFCFGGVNLNKSGIEDRTDYIFHLKNEAVADRLVKEQIAIEKQSRDKKYQHNTTMDTPYGEILLDGGHIGRSVIFDRAVKLAENAEKIILVSQYCPGKPLADVLIEKNSSIYFNPKGTASDTANNIMIGTKNQTKLVPNLYKRHRYLHAKFMIGVMPDGSRRAITGSHNFSSAGIIAGTHEVALETTRSDIIDQLVDFYRKYVA